jgi:hypothetical protein
MFRVVIFQPTPTKMPLYQLSGHIVCMTAFQ